MIRSIGLDIGHSAVRAVALERTRTGWRIAASASVPRRDTAGQARTLGAVVGELDSLIGLGRTPVTVADSEHAILVRFIATIPMPPDRLAKLLRLELSQHTDQGGELAGDSFPVPIDGDEVIHACALGQPPETHAFLAELARAGVTPRRIHVGAAAIYNTTLLAPPVTGDELALLVDIGEVTTRVALVGEGRLLAFRQLATGGQAFTEALATSRAIDPAKAEQLKTHWGLAQAARAAGHLDGATTTATVADSGILPGFIDADSPSTSDTNVSPVDGDKELVAIVEESQGFDDMLEEGLHDPGAQTIKIGGATLGTEMTRAAEGLHVQIFNTLTWFRAQLQRDKLPVSRMLLCGGGAALSGLGPYLSRRLGVPVERFDPAVGLEGDKPEAVHEFAGAIGLAFSEHPNAVRLDLLPETVAKRRLWRERLVWPYVAAAAVVLAATLVCWARWEERAGLQQSLADIHDYQQNRDRLEKELAGLEVERKAQSADLATIASRIHFNRDLLYVIRVLKERVPDNKELWITKLQTIEPETRPVVAKGFSGRDKSAAEETTVERGAIKIEGRVKFSKAKASDDLTSDALKAFFDKYCAEVDSAKAGSDGEPLFDRDKTHVDWIGNAEEKPASGSAPAPTPRQRAPVKSADGSVSFGFSLFFRPTELNQGTVKVEKTGVETP